jgi:hypothetical protein
MGCAEAAQTDEGTETIWLAFSNPTRKDGRFHEVAFGSRSHRWKTFCIDSREVPGTNKEQIAEWEQDHGENSDFFRVWVRGLPPITGDIQFIDSERVWEAQKREVSVLPDEPLILGIDLARGGEDDNVLRYRQGLDARSIPPIRIPGVLTRDSTVMITKIADEVRTRRPDAIFLDETGGSIGGPIGDRLRLLGINVIGVQFGGWSPDQHYANMRAYMWALGREWLGRGAIDKDPKLEAALCGPGYSSDRHDKLVLESKESMKKRRLRSPDDADALFLTFAQQVMPKPRRLEPDRWRERAFALAGVQSWMA